MFLQTIAADKAMGDKFTRRVIVPMTGLVVLAIIVVLGFVMFSAMSQNRLAVEASAQLAQTALQVKEREIGRNLKDYAVWEDAYKNLAQTLNYDWASTDGNVGANILTSLGYNMAFVADPLGQTIYAVVEGEPQDGSSFDFHPEGLSNLVAAGRNEVEPAVGLVRAGNNIYLVAATSILPPSIDGSAIPESERTVLAFVKTIGTDFLSGMSQDYLLTNLRLVDPNAPTLGASIPLLGHDGREIGQLTWIPDQPGTELQRFVLPPLCGSMIGLACFAWLVMRNARRSAHALENSARTVEAYAQTLASSEARFRDVAEASSDWIWECDPALRLVFLSARFTEVTGIAAANVLGKSLEQFFSSDTESAGWSDLISGAQKHESLRDIRCCYRDANGHNRICRLAGRPIIDAKQGFVGYRGTATDITEEVEAQARATHLALHDPLTELPNRVLFRERLTLALTGNKQETARVAILCLDLDHFKEVNDTLGHGIGDLLLQEVAERLLACVRPTDTVARLGGDEFAIIQVGVNQPVEAGALSRKIIDVVKQPFQIDGHELHVGVSIGVAFPEVAEDDPERLLKNADIALYRAKQGGRGIARYFEAQMDLELQARKSLEYDLRQALLKDELEVHYQPLIDLDGAHIAAVEALLRWRHPQRGLVAPGDFIGLAEETGLIIPIGEWVLRTACKQALAWDDIVVAVNLSPVQFRHRELVEMIRAVLEETGLNPKRLELEITESVLLHDSAAALEVLTSLKQLGVNIAMDDFGTGYSSLGYLNSFPFDKIKIDKSFISDLTDSDKSSAIVKSVISLGQSLSMTTTAEGVETQEQATFLHAEGCRQVQGYFFGRPVPASELTNFMRTWKGFEHTPSGIAAA